MWHILKLLRAREFSYPRKLRVIYRIELLHTSAVLHHMHFALTWLVLGWLGTTMGTATLRTIVLIWFNVSREDSLLSLFSLNFVCS